MAVPVRRQAGAPLGLLPFLIPDWPSPAIFAQLVSEIKSIGCAGWELGLPSHGASKATGPVIAQALNQSAAQLETVASYARTLQNCIALLYPGLIARLGREGLLEMLAGRFDGIMLEDDAGDVEGWENACARHDLAWVETCNVAALTKKWPVMTARTPAPITYLRLSPRTGEPPASLSELADAIGMVREGWRDTFITVGFGISQPNQLEGLARIEGLDAVSIGTELLRKMESGSEAAAAFFARMSEAAGHTVHNAKH